MPRIINEWHLDAALGGLIVVFLAYSKWSAYRFRKRAVAVKGEVIKVFGHSRFTSYFVSYSYKGMTRVAEYCGLPMIKEYAPGDSIEIMIDQTDPPNTPVPDKWHNAPGAHGGNCSLPGVSLFSLIDIIYVGASVFLIARSFGWKL